MATHLAGRKVEAARTLMGFSLSTSGTTNRPSSQFAQHSTVIDNQKGGGLWGGGARRSAGWIQYSVGFPVLGFSVEYTNVVLVQVDTFCLNSHAQTSGEAM